MNNHYMKGSDNSYTMMIDSGTTFSYFPEPVYDLIETHFKWFCSMDSNNNCKGKMDFHKRGYLCWHYDDKLFPDGPIEFFASLPILRLLMDTEDR